MSKVNFLPGISQHRITTTRLEIAYLEAGQTNPVPLLLIHGNVSCSWFFEELALAVGDRYHVYAPDMRGFGDSQVLPVDATRGVGDFADDLFSFVQALGLEKFHLLGWSLGGNIAIEYTIAHPDTVQSLVLEAPGSPFGFGGTHGPDGQPNWPDWAGSGGGTANPVFVTRLGEGDRSSEEPVSPRNVMNSFYFKPPFKPAPEREETYLSAMLATKVGQANYPGDLTTSANWPGLAPGTQGVNNTIAPQYLNQANFADINPKPDVLWIRGEDDQIVSDTSLFDLGMLGQLGAVPDWPGAEIYPPQPMIAQMRAVLSQYRQNGGFYEEITLPDCGHSPHIEKAEHFSKLLLDFFKTRDQ